MVNPIKQKAYWDRASEKKTFTHPLNKTELYKHLKKTDRVFDYGCGYGRTLSQLYKDGFKSLVGIDFSEGMKNRAKKEFPYLNIMTNKGNKVPFEADSFDAVILFALLTCVPRNEDQGNIMKEIKRVLKKGGLIYISDYLIGEDLRSKARYDKFKTKYGIYGIFELPEGTVLRHHSEERINELTKDFQKIWYNKFHVKTMNGNNASAFQFIGKLIK